MKSLDSMNIGIVGVNTGNIQAYQSAIKGLSAEQAVFALKTKGANAAQIEEIMTTQTATLAKDAYTQADIQAALAKNGLSTSATILTTAQQKEIVQSGLITSEKLAEVAATLGLTTAEDGSLITKKALNIEMVKQQLTSMGVVGAAQQQILVMLGLVTAEGGAVAGTNVLTASFAKLWAVITAHPIGAIITAVGALAVGITAAVNASNKAKEETRQTAIELTNTYTQEKEALDSQIDKYKELKETLDSGNLSTDEARSIKEQLLEIQQSLIESYGDEASNIDLVNGKYREQLGLLSSLSKEKATEYVTENRDAFSDAKEALEKVRTYNLGTVFSWSSYVSQTSEQKALYDFIDSYSELLDLETKTIHLGQGEHTYKANLSVNATVEDADDIMHQFAVDLENYGKENDIDVSGLLESISKQLKNTWTDELTEYKTVYDEFMKAEIVRNDTLRPLYQESIQAVEEYNNALSTGEGVEEAKANLESVQQSVQNATGELEGSQDVFDGIYEGINKDAEAAYNLDQSFKNDKSVQDYAEQLRGLSDVDLKAINFDNDNTEKGEEAFRGLMETLGLTEDQVQNLIDKLVELGYVQGEVQGSTFDNETADFSTYFNAESFEETAEVLKELAISGEISPKVLTSTETYRQLLEDTGLTAEEAVEKIREIALGESSLADVMSEIKSLAGIIKDVEEEMAENGQVSFDTLQSIAKEYPSLEQYIRDYLNGVEGSYESLVSRLNEIYQQDLSNYDDYYEAKQANDEAWWYDYSNQYAATWIFSLANAYDCDLRNYKTYLEAKEAIGERLDALKTSKEKIQEGLDSGEIADSAVGNTAFGTLIPMLQQQKAEEAAQAMLDYVDEQIPDLQKLYDGIVQDFEDSIITSTDIFKDMDYTSGNSSSESSSEFDWIETKISNLNDELDKLDDKASDVYSLWSDRNEALAASLVKTEDAISLQKQAYVRYMKEADSVGLSDAYKKLVQNGAIEITSLSGTLKEQVEDYQKWYEKAHDCLDTIDELNTSQKELASQKFDNIKSEYESLTDILSSQRDLLQDQIDLAETRGLFANESYYADMIALTQNELAKLTEERKQLQTMIENTSFSQGSEEWNDMFSAILDVDSAINEATKSIVEFNNSIRDTQWEIFDYLEESISRVTNEVDFLVELFSSEKLTDKSGLTSIGDAVNALHLVSYKTYSKQADDYLDEIQELQKQLINGAGTDVLDRYYELIDARQDAILAAQDEKDAILDLIEEGYQAQLDALNEIIDKKKEALDAEKDLYDYQKSVNEQTKNISSLQKQYDMYKNDTSEEGIAKIQQIKVELEEAKADLKETEYEKYLSDQEKMLDSLSDEFETWINERLDNADELFKQIVDGISSNGNEISSVLKEISGKYGVSLSDTLNSIFENSNPFDGTVTAIEDLISSVRDIASANSSLETGATASTGSSSSSNLSNGTISSSVGTKSSNNSSNNNSAATSLSSDWDWLISKKDYYPKSSLNKDTSIIDLLKYHDYDSSVTARSLYYKKLGGSGTFSNSASQNEWLLKQFKSNGYKTGTSFAKAGLSWTQEDGNEIIIRKSDGAVLTPLGLGDKVVNAKGSENLFDFANNPQEFMNSLSLNAVEFNLPKIPDIKPSSAMFSAPTIDVGGVEIICNEVQNAKELMEDVTNQLIKNDRFNRAMSTMVNNEIMGKNSLEHLKYSR